MSDHRPASSPKREASGRTLREALTLWSLLGVLGLTALETVRLAGGSGGARLRELAPIESLRAWVTLTSFELWPVLPSWFHRRLELRGGEDLFAWSGATVAIYATLVGSLTLVTVSAWRLIGRRPLGFVPCAVALALAAAPALLAVQEPLRYRLAVSGLPKALSGWMTLAVLVVALLLSYLVLRRMAGPRWVRGGLLATLAACLVLASIGAVSASRGGGSVARPSAPPGAPNVLLISVDTLRADHLGAYGYGRPTSPTMDRLAEEGVLYERAFAPTSWTLPSHVAMLTGRYPASIGVQEHTSVIPRSTPMLAEVLRRSGYRTAGIVAGAYLDASYGFDRGFDLYDDYSVVRPHVRGISGETSSESIRLAIEWLERTVGSEAPPFFLFLHLWDVHYDFEPPPPFDTMFAPDPTVTTDFSNLSNNPSFHEDMPERELRRLVGLYDGEIRYTDGWVRRLLERIRELGLESDTLVVLTSDHGEEFFEHGQKLHSNALYGESVHVPLIMRWPGELPAGVRRAEPVSLADIAPTIVRLVRGGEAGEPGLGADDALRECAGRALDPAAGGAADPRRRIYGSLYHDDQISIRTDDHAFMAWHSQSRERREALFDTRTDPGESRSVASLEPKQVSEFRRLESVWLACWGAQREEQELDPDLERTLRSFGYID